MEDRTRFGNWSTGEYGLPCFDLQRTEEAEGLVIPEYGLSAIWHQVGSDGITATAHAGGWTTLYSYESGLVRLNGVNPARPGELGGLWSVEDDEHTLLQPFNETTTVTARWGTGYAEWTASNGELSIRRRVWAPFGDIPALRIDVEISGGLPLGVAATPNSGVLRHIRSFPDSSCQGEFPLLLYTLLI